MIPQCNINISFFSLVPQSNANVDPSIINTEKESLRKRIGILKSLKMEIDTGKSWLEETKTILQREFAKWAQALTDAYQAQSSMGYAPSRHSFTQESSLSLTKSQKEVQTRSNQSNFVHASKVQATSQEPNLRPGSWHGKDQNTSSNSTTRQIRNSFSSVPSHTVTQSLQAFSRHASQSNSSKVAWNSPNSHSRYIPSHDKDSSRPNLSIDSSSSTSIDQSVTHNHRPYFDASSLQSRQLETKSEYSHSFLHQETDVGRSTRGIPISTGDSQADAEIAMFYKAKEELMARMGKK